MMQTKKFYTALLSAAMLAGTLSPAVSVMAGTGGSWIKSGDLYWYKQSDGTWPAGQWSKISGKWYHFNDQGFMQSGWKKLDGNWYYLGDKNDGSMKTGWVKDGGTYYYLDSSGKMLTGWRTINGKSYYFRSDGSMAQNTTVNGYKVGADGAWIPEQKPSTETTTETTLNSDYLKVVKQALQEAEKEATYEYIIPITVYYNISTFADVLGDEGRVEMYKVLDRVVTLGASGYPNVLSNAFYEYLQAAGYNMSQQFEAYKDYVTKALKELKDKAPDQYPDGIAEMYLSRPGFPYSMTKAFAQQLAAQGLVSQSFADSYDFGSDAFCERELNRTL